MVIKHMQRGGGRGGAFSQILAGCQPCGFGERTAGRGRRSGLAVGRQQSERLLGGC